ncbi:uncharacterized protein KY384_002654 [Bacidia gigantensis]|uniref:uncharacterized protein n=1 Tax=Bacidia gigantensis TaxID=2732470 RepID=UPI001D03CDA7|nr:uncharacterized protein KY384_002654 [Bacidia gigantensis]KAG8532776.1 hypothetical protein KY384_002654 [Bacidia gigantensis]
MNGDLDPGSSSLTAAEKLRLKHEAEAAHHPTIEDVPDEDDLEHPLLRLMLQKIMSLHLTWPPMAFQMKKQASKSPTKTLDLSAAPSGLNTQSEELFPALGSGPKAPTPGKPTTAWGAKKPSSLQNRPNGVNGGLHAPSMNSSRASTPVSDARTPASLHASTKPTFNGVPQQIHIPGKHTESIQFARHQLVPPNKLKKKSYQGVVQDINRRSKAKVEVKPGFNGGVVFEGTGPVDATRQALKDVAKEVGSTQTVKIPIPLSVRSHVIGRQGAMIQKLEKSTGAKVQVPKTEERHAVVYEDDDSQTIDVTIEGDAVAAEMARREVENIINERTSTVNLRLKHIPAEYYPFIAGPHNCRIRALEDGRQVQVEVPQYITWTDGPPPEVSPTGMPPQFTPCSTHHIRISGERLAALQARSEIERQVEELQRQICLSQLQLDRGQRQILLENEDSHHDFLNETGCAIILPPVTADSDILTITGPQNRLVSGLDKIMEIASAMSLSRVDVARQHANAPMGAHAHAHAVTQYLQQRKIIEQLERRYNARIVLPNNDRESAEWEVYVKDGKNGIRARQDILGLISAHPPARIRHVQLDPFFHQHVHQQTARKLKDDYGVQILPSRASASSDHLILVYEGQQASFVEADAFPRSVPLPQEVAEFEQNLEQAQQHILDLISDQQKIHATNVAAPLKYHEKIRKFVQREQESLPQDRVPVQVSFGVSGKIDQGAATVPDSPLSSTTDHHATLRGPRPAADDFAAKVLAFVEAEKQDDLERGHITSFDYPQKHMSHLIGRRGENVNKLREEFDVNIQTKEGRVEIIGPKMKAEQLKARIISQAKQLEDERSHVLKIPSRYHRDIIGAKGSQVNRLQDRHNVRVQFPRAVSASEDAKSLADGASEISPSRNRRPNQGPDEVIVKGPSKGADAARDELLSLLQWTMDNSHASSVRVAQKQLPSLIGQGGQEMEALRLASGAQVDVPSKESGDAGGRVEIQLKGTKKQVEEARKILEQKSRIFDSTVSRSINIDRKHHRALIGSGGSNIRNIVVAAGGSDDRRDLARTVRFPRQDSDTDAVQVEGDSALVDKIIAAMQDFATQKEGQMVENVVIPPQKHRLLIGPGGETRRRLESQFKVELYIPKTTEESAARSNIKISGQAADIEKAKAHILSLTEDQPGETIQIPRKHHHSIADNGRFFRHLRNDLHVTVDHGNQRPPAKPTSTSVAQNSGSSMPLITDDPNSMSTHSFNIVNGETVSSEEGSIPWNLKGTPENIAAASSALDRALEAAAARESQVTGYLVLPDPSLYRYVIGKGGSKINDIRAQTGCKITVPRQNSDGNAIEIVGGRDGVEHARDIILDAVDRTGGY